MEKVRARQWRRARAFSVKKGVQSARQVETTPTTPAPGTPTSADTTNAIEKLQLRIATLEPKIATLDDFYQHYGHQLDYGFDQKTLRESEIRELMFREILEYHEDAKAQYMSTNGSHVYHFPSQVDLTPALSPHPRVGRLSLSGGLVA